MILNVQRIVNRVRNYIQDPAGIQQGNSWTDAQIVDALNEEHQGLVAKCVQSGEDYFLAKQDVALTAGQVTVPLFDGFLYLRYLETFPVSGEPSGAIESRLIEGVSGSGSGEPAVPDAAFYYALTAEGVDLAPAAAGGETLRGWYIQAPAPLICELAASVPAADKVRFSTTGDAPNESTILVGTKFDVVAGTGIGQQRKVTVYTASTREATFETPFSPALDTTSKLASIPRIPRLFHDLLTYGGAIRCLAMEKEQAGDIAALYADRMEDFVDFIERSRTGGQRSVAPFDLDDY